MKDDVLEGTEGVAKPRVHGKQPASQTHENFLETLGQVSGLSRGFIKSPVDEILFAALLLYFYDGKFLRGGLLVRTEDAIGRYPMKIIALRLQQQKSCRICRWRVQEVNLEVSYSVISKQPSWTPTWPQSRPGALHFLVCYWHHRNKHSANLTKTGPVLPS